MASALPDVDRVSTSEPRVARGLVLDVPRYSQMIHAGEYPRDGGTPPTPRSAGHAFVTRFASLRGVERFIRAGIPVVTSVTFGRGELTGAPMAAGSSRTPGCSATRRTAACGARAAWAT